MHQLTKRLSLPALLGASLVVMTVMAACGGSGGRSTDTPPSLGETVNSVNQAQTPAQGQFAARQVYEFLGIEGTEAFDSIPQADRDELTLLMGGLIAQHNQNPLSTTYGDVLDEAQAEYEVDIDEAAAMVELNQDLAAPNAEPEHNPNDLLLIGALEGTNATLDKQISPTAALALANWFIDHYVPAEVDESLVRDVQSCRRECSRQYQMQVRQANRAMRSDIVRLRALLRRNLITQQQYTRLVTMERREYLLALNRARARRTQCFQACHSQ